MNQQARDYAEQLGRMVALAKAWRTQHPNADAKVQFNFPREVCFVSLISDAIAQKIVTTNPDGLELVKALWPWGDKREPTILMVRAVLEAGSDKSDGSDLSKNCPSDGP